jgi:two-component system sensor histidine kinase RegB
MSQAIDSWRGPASRYNVRFETNVRTVITPISPQTRNLRRLVALRAIEVVGQIGVTAVAAYGLALALPTAFLFALSAGLGLVNMFVWWRLYQPWPVIDAELMANLILDIGVLTALLYFAGGSTNPFVTLYLLPLSIAAAILPTRYTWTLVAITLACYSLLLFVYVPLPHETNSLVWLLTWLPASSGGEHAMHGGQADFGLHVLGMWFNFAVSASLIAWFVVRMAQSLRDRDRQLAHAREAALRNEQLIALGMLAAGAAHELGTPLATMAVIAHELAHDHAHDPTLAQDLRLLRTQTDACKDILNRLTAAAGETRAGPVAGISCEHFLRQLIERWQLLRPQIVLEQHFIGAQPVPMIAAEHSLEQALFNLLNNAADVSPASVEFEGRWAENQLTIEIRDRGPGLSEEVAQRAGQAFFTTKGPHGLGIGLFLANASIERYGGTVSLFNRDGGGACVRVTLPLQALPPSI